MSTTPTTHIKELANGVNRGSLNMNRGRRGNTRGGAHDWFNTGDMKDRMNMTEIGGEFQSDGGRTDDLRNLIRSDEMRG